MCKFFTTFFIIVVIFYCLSVFYYEIVGKKYSDFRDFFEIFLKFFLFVGMEDSHPIPSPALGRLGLSPLSSKVLAEIAH